MTPDTAAIALTAAFVMGLSGSAHCFGMCGGLATAFGARLRTKERDASPLANATTPQLGRIVSYTSMGAICGGVGQALQALLDMARLGVALRALSGALLLLVAARLLFRWNGLAALERLGVYIWRVVQPLTRSIAADSTAQPFLLGIVWGFLPCGMVYSMLAFAALSGSAVKGAALLLAFGAGTAPAMLLGTLAAAKSMQVMNSAWGRRFCGSLLATYGAWLLITPLKLYFLSLHTGPH